MSLVLLSLQPVLIFLVTSICRLRSFQWAYGSLADRVDGPPHSSGLPKCGWMAACALPTSNTSDPLLSRTEWPSNLCSVSVQCLGRFSGIIVQDPIVSNINHLYVDIFQYLFVKWRNILEIPLNQLGDFTKVKNLNGYFPNSISSYVTTLIQSYYYGP